MKAFQILLYNFGIKSYFLAINIASIFNVKAMLWLKGRKNIWQKIAISLNASDNNIWIHCASLGEFEQGRPLIEYLKNHFPDKKIILTFFSPSGFEVRKNYEFADYIFYLPLDTAANAQKFIQITKPEFAVFVKYEFWFHYIHQLKQHQIPVYLISAIFRENQIFFRPYGGLFKEVLQYFTHIFVQNQKSLQLLQNIGITTATIAPDTRFDRVFQISQSLKNIKIAENFSANYKTIIAGSTWPQDEKILVRFINDNKDLKYIIAPHEISKNHIHTLKNSIQKKVILYSAAEGADLDEYDVLIIDNIGLLSSLYQYGTFSYIGGGFGSGIHNILEPAIFGLPVIFGPRHQKFAEAVALREAGGAFVINNYEEFESISKKLIFDQKFFEQAATASYQFTRKNIGGTTVIAQKIMRSTTENAI